MFWVENCQCEGSQVGLQKTLLGPKSLGMRGKSGNILILARSIPILA
jgi:hypothetical protein